MHDKKLFWKKSDKYFFWVETNNLASYTLKLLIKRNLISFTSSSVSWKKIRTTIFWGHMFFEFESGLCALQHEVFEIWESWYVAIIIF